MNREPDFIPSGYKAGLVSFLAPEVGLEPTTHRLTADCSAIELLGNVTGSGENPTRCAVRCQGNIRMVLLGYGPSR